MVSLTVMPAPVTDTRAARGFSVHLTSTLLPFTAQLLLASLRVTFQRPGPVAAHAVAAVYTSNGMVNLLEVSVLQSAAQVP